MKILLKQKRWSQYVKIGLAGRLAGETGSYSSIFVMYDGAAG